MGHREWNVGNLEWGMECFPWNLQIKDTVGPAILEMISMYSGHFVERLSSFREDFL